MKKSCTHCGKPFEAKRSDAKYCSRTCSSKASIARNKVVSFPTGTGERIPELSTSGRMVQATEAALEKFDALETVRGEMALMMARRLDAGEAESATGVVQLSKQLEALMVAIESSSKPAESPLSLLRDGAREKRAG